MTHDLAAFETIIASSGDDRLQQRKATITLRTQLSFIDGSVLHIRENTVRVTGKIDYAYQWQTADHQLIHRWDNAHAVDLPTSPHHQHIGSEENVVASEPLTLEKVLTFIAAQLISD